MSKIKMYRSKEKPSNVYIDITHPADTIRSRTMYFIHVRNGIVEGYTSFIKDQVRSMLKPEKTFTAKESVMLLGQDMILTDGKYHYQMGSDAVLYYNPVVSSWAQCSFRIEYSGLTYYGRKQV